MRMDLLVGRGTKRAAGMLRIRRRFALLLCGVCAFLFITLYFIINYAAPAEDAKPNFGAMQSKLRQLESGIMRHDEEMRKLEHQMEHNFKQQEQQKVAPHPNEIAPQSKKNVLGSELIKPRLDQLPVVSHSGENQQCSVDFQQVPQPDVQMLDMYERMSFADIDGGVWKQGWNIKYDPLQFNDHHKLKVFVVPHSHNDPGWVKTFDDYYEHDTKHILSNALRHLRENPEMKFIWAEISYFSRFFEDLGENNKEDIRKLVQNHQLEFVTGGWVMPDEANSHWLSVLLQLTEGQTWLKRHLNVTPTSSWSIDPFGHSPTMPYILRKSGFKNLLIQRTHYSVKKELAQKRQLEFHWRQLWDDIGTTDLFTHMMPFYSYDIPHTCGPDPKVCCQFDFKRIPRFGLTCPWRVPPKTINDDNVAERSELIIDQWKKKAELYRTNVVLIPLGDDFRYSQSTEWDVQRVNFEALFDHINSERKYFVEAKFGTLQEYFDAVHAEPEREFPVLSGDFFTYADRTDNYWSGYYTSRPYHKRMDRVLLHYVRTAEILRSWQDWEPAARFDEMLQNARRELSLFQHHDGITGTAKTHVVEDYARRMVDAVKACKHVMQQAVYRQLTKPSIYHADYKFNYFFVDDSRWPSPDDGRTTIILGDELPSKHVVVHNSLPQWREDLVDFYVSNPYVSVTDFDKNPVQAQVNPVWTWHRHTPSNTVTPQASSTKYRLVFKAEVPPLGLRTYIITLEAPETNPPFTSFAASTILSPTPISANLGDFPQDVKFGEHRDLSLRVGNGPTVAFSSAGFMKSIQIDEQSPHTPVHLKFYKYGTRANGERSGAYLFLPNGPATAFVNAQLPVVLVIEGRLETSVTTGQSFVVHQTVLRGGAPEIRNIVDIKPMEDVEVAMRISTHIRSEDVFYTDLNGLQMVKRRHFNKLPLQANFYPVPGAIYVEDAHFRLTVVSAQPLGGASLSTGEVEIMQDRRLSHDDERGVGQGVLDNQPVLHIFRVLLEKIEKCTRPAEAHPAGVLTVSAYRASRSILNPLDKFIYAEIDWLGAVGNFGAKHTAIDEDMELVALRSLAPVSSFPIARDRHAHVTARSTGIIVHRTVLLQCPNNAPQRGVLPLLDLLEYGEANVSGVNRTTLTFLQPLELLSVGVANTLALCPMDTKAFVLHLPHRSDDGADNS